VNDRAFLIHYHAVTLTQSRVFLHRGDRRFSFTLLEWAGNARRRFAALPRESVQQDLFA
jgi:hypothetical protein